ncbi:glycosyltransferase family 4 protein [Streptomyces sp. B1866]|uniref:glycosyltransferase family 4 protein n=1 Tax=Streptomyces sp. B1866 TaxID=3075431 RepID=UPI0028914CEB|nr:glycosyltransferase family 4 protein [Streptomyces sp. B1866]MDT3398297.1 glycosyltransferase family 4 protein [Streptomyces sp. B1866]
MAVALHDGYFGTGTGAGRSNRALLDAVVGALAPGIGLVLLPVLLLPGSPEYDRAAHQAAHGRLAAVPYQVIPLDNGTGGMRRFGDLVAFQRLNQHAAAVLHELAARHQQGLLIAIDQPFAGLGPLLEPPVGWRLLYLPRSCADHHADAERAAWEEQGLAGWTQRGAVIGAISAHMRALLVGKGVPAAQILDVPGGLAAADRVPLDAAPPLPAEARNGFVLAMGRAQPYKGFEDLLDALARLTRRGVRAPHLLLAAVTDAGPTAYQRHLREHVAELGLDVTLWTRFHPGLPGLLHHPRLRAVVVPSRAEPLGRIPLEAFAAGAARVVATTAGGLAETVIEGTTGYTAPPNDPQALADAVLRALTAPPEQVERLRAAGAALVATRDYTRCITGVLTALAPWATAAAATKP